MKTIVMPRVNISRIIGVVVITAILIGSGLYFFQVKKEAQSFEHRSQLLDNIALAKELPTLTKEQKLILPISGLVDHSYLQISINGNSKTEFSELDESHGYEVSLNEGANDLIIYQYIVNGKNRKESKYIHHTVILDTIPPKGDVKIDSEIPLVSKDNKIQFDVEILNSDTNQIRVGYKTYTADENNHVHAEIDLSAVGRGGRTVALVDEAGNEIYTATTINTLLDQVAPTIVYSLYACSSSIKDQSRLDELVCISSGQFYGPLSGTAYVPITGQVIGNIEKVTFDGKTLNVKDDLTINQKIPVYVTRGTNNFEIKVTDKAGNTSTKVHPIEWDTEENNSYNDLQNQIDDLQSELDSNN